MKRTLTPPPHERRFYHRRLLGDLISFQRNRGGIDLDRSGPVASSRETQPPGGGAARSITENTGAFTGHGFAGHKSRRHRRASSLDAISRFQIWHGWFSPRDINRAADLSF